MKETKIDGIDDISGVYMCMRYLVLWRNDCEVILPDSATVQWKLTRITVFETLPLGYH